MSTYGEASQLKAQLTGIINDTIENHPLVRAAIKARKAVVWEEPNETTNMVKVKFLPDIFNNEIEPLEFPYNSQMKTFLKQATPKKTTVSVWYNYSASNGVVMQDDGWTK